MKEVDKEIEYLLADINELKKEAYFARSARSASPYAPIQSLIIVVCIIVIVLVVLEICLHNFGFSDVLYERLGFPHTPTTVPSFLHTVRGVRPSL